MLSFQDDRDDLLMIQQAQQHTQSVRKQMLQILLSDFENKMKVTFKKAKGIDAAALSHARQPLSLIFKLTVLMHFEKAFWGPAANINDLMKKRRVLCEKNAELLSCFARKLGGSIVESTLLLVQTYAMLLENSARQKSKMQSQASAGFSP